MAELTRERLDELRTAAANWSRLIEEPDDDPSMPVRVSEILALADMATRCDPPGCEDAEQHYRTQNYFRCEACNGTGHRLVYAESVSDSPDDQPCELCKGTGRR